ncbi:hypothetical protein JCGZ_05809 [Jatropha curcas]|uniref:Uncharacterized protein n=1 Tax=Jatropha curcas TaxID=180498 RepID=A0A067JJ77_JATCU|nr:hypothetical protein JCGZ_05809 [Jatropha curcas]
MRPTGRGNSTESSSSSILKQWSSPLPYVFVGLVIILGLMSIALVILACSNYKSSSLLSRQKEEEEPKETTATVVAMEPKIVVIMAGDHHPTYVAKPSALNCHNLSS